MQQRHQFDSFASGDVYQSFRNAVEEAYKRNQAGDSRTRLEAIDISLDVYTLEQIESKLLGDQISLLGVPLRNIELGDGHSMGNIVRGCIKACQATSDGISLKFSGKLDEERNRIAVFSSIAANKSLKSLTLGSLTFKPANLKERVRLSTLRWVAFSVFSPFSRCSLDSFKCWYELSSQDVAAMVEVIIATNPLQLLLVSTEVECKAASLLESMPLRPKVLPGTFVWIVHGRVEEPTVEVLVPGHGVRSIERVKLGVSEVLRSEKSLSNLGMMRSNRESLRTFIRTVGPSLKDVSLGHAEDRDQMLQILQACPNILRIRMSPSLCLDTLLDRFETAKCHVEALSLHGYHSGDPSRVNRFITSLQERKGSLSRQLSELSIDLVAI